MPSATSTKSKTQKAIQRQLAELFKKIPDVFVRYPELLEDLVLEDDRGANIASLLEKQAGALKKRIQEQQQQTQKLVKNAQHHEFITNRLFDITYELTGCSHIEGVFDVLYQDARTAFELDFVGVKVTSQHRETALSEINPMLVEDIDYQHVLERVQQGNSLCGDQFPEGVLQLFFGDHAQDVGSAAFVPLIKPNTSDSLGILALGSTDEQKFASKTNGTVHLDRLGKVSAIAINRLLEPERPEA